MMSRLVDERLCLSQVAHARVLLGGDPPGVLFALGLDGGHLAQRPPYTSEHITKQSIHGTQDGNGNG